MKNLSNIEAALLISIKLNPDRHQVFHAGSVCATIFEIGRAVTTLKNLNYITENDRGRFHVNQAVLDRLNTEVMHEENSSGVVHRSDSSAPSVSVDTSKPLPTKPTPESLLQQLAEFGKRGAVAQTLANSYGVRGIAIAQMLRRLREEGKVTKHETFWFIATKDDAVETIAVPYETRRAVSNADELQKLIKLQKGWFTAKESYDELSKAFIVDWSFFYGVFMEMSGEGHFNIKENGIIVSYEHSYDADNKHSNCRWDETIHDADRFNKVVQDYIYLVQQGGSKRWSLEHCVEVTKIQSDLLLHWFELAGFDIDNIDSIGKKEQPDFMPVDRLNAQAVQDFISDEGCSVKAFVKFFNLDPAVTDKIGSILAQVGLARYDAENKFIMLPNDVVVSSAADEPRVTSNPETGIDTIEMVQIPNEGFVFIEVEVDPTRAVTMQYFYGNSAFNGMHITPTDRPNVYNLQVPVELAQSQVDIEGMYERVRVDQADDGLPRMVPASGGDHVSKSFEERAEEQKENPPEKMYFNGERPNSATLGPSPETKAFIDEILANIKEHIPADGPVGPQGHTSYAHVVAVEEVGHSSMLQIDQPLVGMHLFRVSELAKPQQIPETVEDENSPYFGCKITPCTGDQIGYATITIEPGHPMWQAPQYTPRTQAYARNADGTLVFDVDENGVYTPRRVGEIVPEENENLFGADCAEEVQRKDSDCDDDPEAEEYAAALEPHLKHLLEALAGVPTRKQMYEMFKEIYNGVERMGNDPEGTRMYSGVKGTACSGGGVPMRTVKPEWVSGLALIADQHKRSSATHKLLMEIKEYLEK